MDYPKFLQQLPELYENWGQASARPKSPEFTQLLAQLQDTTSTSIMQLLHCAIDCITDDEVYCQIGGITAAHLIGALINHPDQIAYAADNSFDLEQKFEQFSENLSLFNLDEQVIFTPQDWEEFFRELREIQPEMKIGVFVYVGAQDYRSQLLPLLLVKPFLADQAIIIIEGSNFSTAQQAHWDFLAATPQTQLLLNLPATASGNWGKGLHIFSWDVTQHHSYDESSFVFRHQPVITALSAFADEFELHTKGNTIELLKKQALELESNQQVVAAAEIYQQILSWSPNHADAYYHLAMIDYDQHRYAQSLNLLLKSINLDDSIAEYHYSLGLVSEKLCLTAQALQAYKTAVTLNPNLVDAYNNLGNLLFSFGEIEPAKLVYQQGITADPQHFGSYINLGNLLISQQQVDEAIDVYESALKLHANNEDILHNLKVAQDIKYNPVKDAIYWGNEAYAQGKYEEAIAHYEKALGKPVENILFYIKLAECYKKTYQPKAAINTYKEGIKHYPTETYLYLKFMAMLQQLGKESEAIAVANQAVQLLPHDFAIKIEQCRVLPIIYENAAEIEVARSRFIKHLLELISQISLDNPETKANILKGLSHNTNFYLHYQGKNDLELQTKYGQFVHQAMAATYPEWVKPLPMPPLETDGKIRVGYISNNMNSHVVACMTIGWLKKHNRHKFKIYSYALNESKDFKTQEFIIYSDIFHHIPGDIEAVCQQILNDQLHLLVFLDISMHPIMTLIGALRLAPVQCTTWGHPISSGLPTMDYFLSCELMEPEKGEEHYSEKLIKLPNIGLYYEQPSIPETTLERSYFKLDDDKILYLSCQSLYKYLPQYDYVFAAIAQRVPSAHFAFIGSHISEAITEKFKQRLQKVFASYGLNSEDYCVILPRLDGVEYTNLNLVSDIYLDTFSWSGGNTTMTAVASNLPVVTCPGEFMRGRHSYGILQMLGVTETIASSEAEYIEIAVKLGLNKEWRESIVAQFKQNQHRIFEDKTCVVALEEFYRNVVQKNQLSQ
ncbi:Tetratricopeptide TPR_2 repeat-containing protein [Crinalium epipsammum PCC 9333]|uniref:protein O-GlcNAc transferase n=1 Tax=Crinalium epipsammum PCC 9333 TaxID=1173022 RepID=K9W446_9CYAN|nr:tetratricopeptide repeat protein [Crinalium epipsammum]AFZ14220.1 Tetratricopeptide TPR_2 repeat-containing protein [Crinalium epipsammum PCC 9333]